MFAKRAFLESRDARCDEYALWSPTMAQVVRVLIAAALVAAISGPAAAAPTVTPAASTVPAGAPLIFTVVNDGTPSPTDWLGLYQTGVPDAAYMAWQYMNGLKTPAPSTGVGSATLRFSAPPTPGTYEVRFFSNNGFARLATSSTVTVPPPTVTATAPTVVAGSPIGFVVTGGPANPVDWVGLYRTTTSDGAYITWQYLNGTMIAPATGTSAATLQFVAPMTPGTYELRFFSNDTFIRLATSSAVTITPAVASVTLAGATRPDRRSSPLLDRRRAGQPDRLGGPVPIIGIRRRLCELAVSERHENGGADRNIYRHAAVLADGTRCLRRAVLQQQCVHTAGDEPYGHRDIDGQRNRINTRGSRRPDQVRRGPGAS